MNEQLTQTLLAQLDVVRKLASDMRFGQMLATLGLLGEDMTGRTLWDIEDEQLLEVIERFRRDLERREPSVVVSGKTDAKPD